MARTRINIDEVESNVTESDRYDTGLLVERKRYYSEKAKRFAYHYFVGIKFENDIIDADFVPKGNSDIGGYNLLESVFGDKMEMPLYAKDLKFKNDEGEEIESMTFHVVKAASNGFELEVDIKPSKNSDKKLMEFAMSIVKAKRQEELEASAEDKPDNTKKVKKTE
jgi:hypothetical protein